MVNIVMFIHNKYHAKYYKIIDRAQRRILADDVKFEVHHIIPRSLGGLDDEDNLVKLTLKEHWICHRLLVKFLDNPTALRKMYNALFMMAVKDYRTVNCRIYEQIKKNIIPWNKGLTGLYKEPMNEAAKNYLRDLWKGKKRPPSHVDAMKEGWKKAKANGYVPWNKGKTGFKGPCQQVILISPSGEELQYNSLKEACKINNLAYTKMSSVKSGKLSNYKGWKIRPVNTV